MLDYLAHALIDSGFDVRHVIRLICRSRIYQLSIETNKWNSDDKINYSHAVARRLPAEVLYDAIHRATGSVARIPGVPVGTRAAALPDSGIELADGFLATLGRPARESACGGSAKSVIMCYLQGGPSHLDLWDPKENVPDNVRSVFQPIATKIPGIQFTEILPKLAQVNDRLTMIRSMSYTPNGLFNHTAAIYQMMTGYTTDKVSPSGQLEPPSPKDFPNFGSQIIRLQPTSEPMLPFVINMAATRLVRVACSRGAWWKPARGSSK